MSRLDRIAQTKKEQKLISLRQQGFTDSQIAAMEGYSSVQAANRAILNALAKHPQESFPDDPDIIRGEVDAGNSFLREQLMHLIRNPPVAHSAIGRVIYDPRTCTCGTRDQKTVKGAEKPHAEDCQRQPVLDESARIRAISEYRKLGDQRTDMHAAKKRHPIDESEAMRQLAEYLATLPPPDTQHVHAELIDTRPLDTPPTPLPR